MIPQKQLGGKGQTLFPYPGMDYTSLCVVRLSVCSWRVLEGRRYKSYVALVQNSTLCMIFVVWCTYSSVLDLCSIFLFSCFRLPMEMWKQRWYASTEEETYQVHWLYWQTNMQVSLFVFRFLLHKIAKLG